MSKMDDIKEQLALRRLARLRVDPSVYRIAAIIAGIVLLLLIILVQVWAIFDRVSDSEVSGMQVM